MELDQLIARLTKLRETMPGNTKVKVGFSTPNESWEEPLDSVDVLRWDNGTPDAVGLSAEWSDEEEEDDDD